ncbi:MAG: pacearchaeosortase [archaeon]
MNKQSKKIYGLFARYFAILLVGMGNLYIIYKLLTPLTIYTLNAIVSIFTTTTLADNIIYLNSCTQIEIVPACVAGAAFYLLFFLVLSSADVKPEMRAKAVLTAFVMFFALNLVRILILIPMIDTSYFATVHWIFWHIISTIFVVGVWFSVVKIYKIKSIPIYSDLKYIKSLMNPVKKSKRKNKHK